MKSKIWLSSPHMSGKEIGYIQQAFEDNWIAPLGPHVNNFSAEIENYLDAERHVTAVTSGTAALHLALLLLGVRADDEVICQSFTFAATANPIVYVGAKPIFVDSERETWNMCPKTLKTCIDDRIKSGKTPKAIILVHLYGMPAQMDEIMEIATEYEIPIIEDAAEALGSSYKGKKCGTFGEMAILSFNGNKIITTSGGGALVCSNAQQQERALYLATQARDATPYYQHSEVGYNYRMSNICAAIGRGQLEVIDERVASRRKNHQFYKELFRDFEGVTVFSEPNTDFYSNHWLSTILIDEKVAGFSKEDLRLELAENNIEARPLWKPMHLQPVFQNTSFYGSGICEKLFEKGLCLPSGSNLKESELERIKEVIFKFK